MLGILFAILVAIIWSIGEVHYSKVSKKYEKNNVYYYTFLLRTILYSGIVFLLKRDLIGSFSLNIFLSIIPVIICDMTASLVINPAMTNGKLSVVSPIMASYPVIDIVLGIILLNERITMIENILVVLISLSIIILAMNQKKTRKAPHPKRGIFFSFLYMILVALSIYFEKKNYNSNITIYDLYYYKGIIYFLVSIYFAGKIKRIHKKIKRINLELIKGCGLTPIGNVLDSVALNLGDMAIITPISALYAVITNLISRFILKEKTSIKERVCIACIIISTLILIILKI